MVHPGLRGRLRPGLGLRISARGLAVRDRRSGLGMRGIVALANGPEARLRLLTFAQKRMLVYNRCLL